MKLTKENGEVFWIHEGPSSSEMIAVVGEGWVFGEDNGGRQAHYLLKNNICIATVGVHDHFSFIHKFPEARPSSKEEVERILKLTSFI